MTVAEATLGAEIDVPTLEGVRKYKIPEGTQPGTQFTLRQCGVPYINSPSRRGDLIFTVNIETMLLYLSMGVLFIETDSQTVRSDPSIATK